MLSVQCHTSLNTDCSCSYLLSTTPIIKLPILHSSPAFPSFPWSPFDLAARPASQDFLKVVSLAPLLPVLREADIFRALIEKQWLDSWLAGLADNKACSSGLYLCSTCHLCVLEWILQARACVCVSELYHAAISCEVSSNALAVFWGYDRLSLHGCVWASTPYARMHAFCPCDCAVSTSSHVLTARSESEHTSFKTCTLWPHHFNAWSRHCGLFIHSRAFHTLPTDSDLSLMLQSSLPPLLYSFSVSTCHWALCFMSREESWMRTAGPGCEVNV